VPPLRIGLVLHEAASIERWAVPVLERLLAGEGLAAAGIAVAGARPDAAGAAFRLYRALDRRLLGLRPDPHARESLDARLGGLPRIALDPHRAPDAARLAPLGAVDLWLDLTRGTPVPGLAGHARLGVLAHPDREGRDPAALGFWPIHRGVSASEVAVLHEAAGAPPRVACRSYTSTRMGSLHRNRGVLDRRFAGLLVRCLDALARRGAVPDAWVAEPEPLPPLPDRSPGAAATLAFVAGLAARLAGRLVEARRFGDSGQRWSLAYRRAAPPVDGRFDAEGFRYLHAPPGRFYADPFVIEEQGRCYLFFEDFDLATRDRAHLSCVQIADDAEPSPAREVLACDYHLSYPSWLRHEGRLYLLPETSENRTVEAWRPVDFPTRWERHHVLLDGLQAADATVFERDGSWWMFAAVSPDGSNPHEELHLFWADQPFGAWTPHPENPVVSDVRRARPAGNVVCHDGVWLRPSQDCAGLYGRATRLNRIDELTRERYRETPIGRVEPSLLPGAVRTHTLSHAAGWQAIDVSLRRPSEA